MNGLHVPEAVGFGTSVFDSHGIRINSLLSPKSSHPKLSGDQGAMDPASSVSHLVSQLPYPCR
jgi:hypothetical protein